MVLVLGAVEVGPNEGRRRVRGEGGPGLAGSEL